MERLFQCTRLKDLITLSLVLNGEILFIIARVIESLSKSFFCQSHIENIIMLLVSHGYCRSFCGNLGSDDSRDLFVMS